MENVQKIGLGIMIAAVVLFLLGFTYVRSAEQALLAGHKLGSAGECVHAEGLVCPYEQINKLAIPKYVGLFADIAVFAFGLVLFLKKKPEEKAMLKARKEARKLGGDEARAFDLITQANGMIFQNELVEKMGVSKVKITRILDKLEAKGLVERKRRGMTNIIVLR